ncbi:MAG: type IV pili twitching motility protein PilT, partial [Gemmatimonadota bacterium]|nr:type IV pili twitching motility protein PilT [Gemmatimonadota bacterium]
MTAPTSNLPPQAASQQINLRTLLEEMLERGASDLHITTGERPMLRIDGDIQPSKQDVVLHPKDTLQLAYSVLT